MCRVAYAASAPRTGTPPIARHVLRVTSCMRIHPNSLDRHVGLAPSRLRLVVTPILHVVEHHHLMVFVDGVVTVNGEAALHVTETDEYLDLVVGAQLHHVLARELDVAGAARACRCG